MKNTAALARGTVVASLAICGVMTVISVLLMPDFSGGEAAWLSAIAAAPVASAVSGLLFAGSQLPFAVGLAGVAHLLRDRTPVLAALGALLAVLGGFGHAVYGGVNLVMLKMADDPSHVDVHVGVLKGVGSGVAVPFMAMGLLGTVLGLVLIGVATWRAQLGPRWLGPVLIAFVVVEFAGAGISAWAGYASGVLFLLGFSTLALTVARSRTAAWRTAAEVGAQEPAMA
ncbi:MAG TPA: hypothetical protein VFL94_16910 [Actinomycetales bacterium]|nr:hypothetical protein [Actinomycetales bacterium]